MKKLAVFFLALSMGCTPTIFKKSPRIQLPALRNWPHHYQQNFQTIKTFQSQARVTVESPEMAVAFTVDVIYAAPDTLFMQAEGPFGIDLGKVFIGRERFIIYNQFNNQFFSGSLDDEYYNTFLETNLTFKQVKYAFMGYSPLPNNLLLVNEEHGIFSARVDNKKWRYMIDTETGLLSLWEIYEGNHLVFQQDFEKYDSETDIFSRVSPGLSYPGKRKCLQFIIKILKLIRKYLETDMR